RAPSLPPGAYTVSVEMQGFKKTTFSNLQLGVDQKLRVDVTLEVGAVTETIQVEGQAPVVKSDTSELAETVTERQIKELPLNGRDFVQLTRILPGVLRGIPGANIDGAGSLAWRASASFSANGQRTRDNNFLLDGIDNNETWLNSVVVFPSIDALEEFKVQTYLSNVPTAAMKEGNFSELTRVIYDPLSQTPFAGNTIPAARFDKAAKNIIDQLYPLPNVPGQRSAATGQTINNFLRNPSQA